MQPSTPIDPQDVPVRGPEQINSDRVLANATAFVLGESALGECFLGAAATSSEPVEPE